MKELLYLEIPTPDKDAVRTWLHQQFQPSVGHKILTPEGIRLCLSKQTELKNPTNPDSGTATPAPGENELSIFLWSLQRTTYIKVFRCSSKPVVAEKQILDQLTTGLRSRFPYQYPEPPEIDLSKQSIFEALHSSYPRTVEFFKKFPNGEYDLTRAYWWEKRWRSSVRNPTQPNPVVFSRTDGPPSSTTKPTYDLIYIGGALGVIHAAVMAKLGYRVLLIERLPFGRMNREWNISRTELQSLIDLGLFSSQQEVDSLIAREYKDGFHKFFDSNNPPYAKAAILHTPTVLNIAIDADKLLRVCGEKLKAAGGEIWDETEFNSVNIEANQVILDLKHLPTNTERQATGRLLVDAMGTASPIAWQLNGGRAFDSVCPTVGAVISGGFEPEVWDKNYGDVLNSHGDISRGRQLIWELFPGADDDLTIYLFHYHQVHPENPGSLLEMYEDFFTILPEYRRCDMEKLVWKKATFGYIPGHFSSNKSDRKIAFDRLVCIGDAASLQSPLVFTGFGSLVRNLPRLTQLLDTALKHDLLKAEDLNKIRAYQSNVAVTWLFSKGMMVPTGRFIEPQKINAILNTFFGILAETDRGIAETFIKDRVDWLTFNRLALEAAWKNPSLLVWILEFVNLTDMINWLGSYLTFTIASLNSLLWGWIPSLTRKLQPWLETRYPALWFKLLATSYDLTDGVGKPQQSS
ncbi:NAD(P)/FAD-dependent oxidoreductase [Ancylothrix sp. D3o]|uniref:NAD(P)/FAD-dependent oxidoreductase n=1 Tax=Ancylothrix sp. D3o TaxID=2953691 RepID=UPI0035C8D91C